MKSAARHAIAIMGPSTLPANIVGSAEQSTVRSSSTRGWLSTTSSWSGPDTATPPVIGELSQGCEVSCLGRDPCAVDSIAYTRPHLVYRRQSAAGLSSARMFLLII